MMQDVREAILIFRERIMLTWIQLFRYMHPIQTIIPATMQTSTLEQEH